MTATKCLVVDDHTVVTQGLDLLLGDMDDLELVGTVHTGEEALDAVERLQPQVVLMDVRLPGIDGVSALDRLRSDPRTAPIPVVALTAYAMKDDRQRFLQAGFDDCVMKPISVRELPTQVRACLEAAHAAKDSE